QLELRRLHDRQIRGIRALEDAARIDAGLTPRVRKVGSVAHEPADFWKFTLCIGRRNSMAHRSVRNVDASAGEKAGGPHKEGVDPIAHEPFKGRVDVAAGAGPDPLDL